MVAQLLPHMITTLTSVTAELRLARNQVRNVQHMSCIMRVSTRWWPWGKDWCPLFMCPSFILFVANKRLFPLKLCLWNRAMVTVLMCICIWKKKNTLVYNSVLILLSFSRVAYSLKKQFNEEDLYRVSEWKQRKSDFFFQRQILRMLKTLKFQKIPFSFRSS